MHQDAIIHNKANLFWLERGGVVADGVIFPDGSVAMKWRGADGSTDIYDSIEVVERVHADDGIAKIVYPYRKDFKETKCKRCGAYHPYCPWDKPKKKIEPLVVSITAPNQELNEMFLLKINELVATINE